MPDPIFTIAQPRNQITLRAGSSRKVSFDLSHTGEGAVHAKVWIEAERDVLPWLSFDQAGEDGDDKVYLDFRGNASAPVRVVVAPPPSADPRDATFRLSIADENRLGDTKVTGQLVQVRVTARGNHSWLKYAVAAVVALVAIGGGWAAYEWWFSCDRLDLPPDLVGKPLPEAKQQLNNAGIRNVVVAFTQGSAEETGRVRSRGNADRVCAGDTVTLTVSCEMVEVPEIVGLRVIDAVNALTTVSLNPRLNTRQGSEGEPGTVVELQNGSVWGEDVELQVGVSTCRGTQVDMVITEAMVPDVVGKTTDQARRALTDAQLAATFESINRPGQPNTVVEVFPVSGQRLQVNSQVVVRYRPGAIAPHVLRPPFRPELFMRLP